MSHTRGTHGVRWAILAVVAMLLAPGPRPVSAANETEIRVLQETPVSPAADVPADVRKECNRLGDELPRAVMRSSRRVALVRTPHELQDRTGRYLSIEITQVRAKAAGALTGPKKLNVRGALVENGKEIADFEAERGAMAAAGTCATLEKAEKELGADIGEWLAHPKPHSRLGDK